MSILSFQLDFYMFASLSLSLSFSILFNHILFGVYCCHFLTQQIIVHFVESI